MWWEASEFRFWPKCLPPCLDFSNKTYFMSAHFGSTWIIWQSAAAWLNSHVLVFPPIKTGLKKKKNDGSKQLFWYQNRETWACCSSKDIEGWRRTEGLSCIVCVGVLGLLQPLGCCVSQMSSGEKSWLNLHWTLIWYSSTRAKASVLNLGVINKF